MAADMDQSAQGGAQTGAQNADQTSGNTDAEYIKLKVVGQVRFELI